MELPEELKELLRLLNSNNVDYLIIGAYALGYHGVPRYTGDLDLFIAPNPDNADALLQTMDNFGFGSLGLEQKDFTTPGNVIQIGNPPLRVDFLTQISGVEWKEVWESRIVGILDSIPVNLISKEHLIRNKASTGRPVDLGDIDRLK